MKRRLFVLAFLPLFLASCGVTRIVTVSPAVYSGSYSTTITVPRTKTVTTTSGVYAVNEDISLYLDLQAVGAAFAQSSSVQEFESLLNNSSYMLSNLDLNNDGYVDYLRVLEVVENHAHVFLIQAVLGANIYQDVATVVAEISPVYASCHVEIIGSSYIYGNSYIVQPIFIATPLIYAHLLRPAYKPWHSPWYWNHYPSYYKRPVPIHLNHYQAYVHTYMTNHHYCHSVSYPTKCRYSEYARLTSANNRNDYGQQHPERSFTVRTADIARNSGRTIETFNARDIRSNMDRTTTTVTSSTRSAAASSSTRSATAVSTSSAGTTGNSTRSTTATTSSSSTRSASTTTSGSSSTRSASTATPSTSTSTRSTGSTSTTTSSGSTRSASTATTTPSSSTRSSSSSSTRSVSSETTVRSRVSNSGSSNTRISTVNESGAKASGSRTSSSVRSASTSASGSSATRSSSSSSSSTRSSSTSTSPSSSSRSTSSTRR